MPAPRRKSSGNNSYFPSMCNYVVQDDARLMTTDHGNYGYIDSSLLPRENHQGVYEMPGLQVLLECCLYKFQVHNWKIEIISFVQSYTRQSNTLTNKTTYEP